MVPQVGLVEVEAAEVPTQALVLVRQEPPIKVRKVEMAKRLQTTPAAAAVREAQELAPLRALRVALAYLPALLVRQLPAAAAVVEVALAKVEQPPQAVALVVTTDKEPRAQPTPAAALVVLAPLEHQAQAAPVWSFCRSLRPTPQPFRAA